MSVAEGPSRTPAAPGPAVGVLRSVNVGLPRDVPWNGTTVHTGIYKQPVNGPRMVRRLNVDGDGQGDLEGHGGEHRAVMVYQESSYDHWRSEFRRDDLEPGMFGENFTVAGLADDEVCIGDRFAIGGAVFEVTQPRVTCYRVGLRLGVPEMASLLVSHHRPGFYLRVIQEGVVAAGDDIVRVATGRHRLTVEQIDGLLYLPNRSRDLLVKAVDEPTLSPGWQQSFRELLEAEPAPGRAPRLPTDPRPGWVGFRPLTVTRTVAESPVVRSLYLTDGTDLPSPRAGQYLTIRLLVDGAPVVRSYSISGRPDPRTYRISVKREEHGIASRYLHDHVDVGDVVDVAAPRGDFVLEPGDEPVVLLSAGIGITPVLSMLSSLAQTDPERAVWWLHIARTALDYGLSAEVDRLLAALPRSHAAVWLTRESAPQPSPTTRHGRPGADDLRAWGFPMTASVYLCGPVAFTSTMTRELVALGFAPGQIHSELFGALPSSTPGITAKAMVVAHAPAARAGAPDGNGTADGPVVTFARSALATPWSSQFQTLLEFAEACDVPTRWSCRTGVCHTCVTGLLSGTVDYVVEPLESPAEGTVLLCCARPTTEVVLDA